MWSIPWKKSCNEREGSKTKDSGDQGSKTKGSITEVSIINRGTRRMGRSEDSDNIGMIDHNRDSMEVLEDSNTRVWSRGLKNYIEMDIFNYL